MNLKSNIYIAVQATKAFVSPLFLMLMGIIWLLTITGFVPYFFFNLPNKKIYINQHIVAGLVFMPLYCIYQIKHYLKIKDKKKSLIYKIGIWLFISILLFSLSGILLINITNSPLINLFHILTSFAFLILLTTHISLALNSSYLKVKQFPSLKRTLLKIILIPFIIIPLLVIAFSLTSL